MNRVVSLMFFSVVLSFSSYGQVAVLKMVGRDANKSTVGFGVFFNYGFPVNDAANQFVVVELLDGAVFLGKKPEEDHLAGYVSIKAGFRNIFSYEGQTGFFVEPQLGYCKVVRGGPDESSKADGVAAAFIAGYSLEVGERGNSLSFALKYEADIPVKDQTLQSLGVRIAYLFNRQRR